MLRLVEKAGGKEEADGRTTLDELAREGARRMLQEALEAEVVRYLERHEGERDEQGRALVVRNGKARARKLTLGAGTIEVQAPRVNDRRTDVRNPVIVIGWAR